MFSVSVKDFFIFCGHHCTHSEVQTNVNLNASFRKKDMENSAVDHVCMYKIWVVVQLRYWYNVSLAYKNWGNFPRGCTNAGEISETEIYKNIFLKKEWKYLHESWGKKDVLDLK